jgi:hypothetical protein
MKVKQEKDGFKPVILILESQNEVDAFWAILNCAAITDTVAIPCNLHWLLTPLIKDGETKLNNLLTVVE